MLDVDVLYRRYGPMVLRRCRRLLGAEDRALDAAQDVFVQVVRHQDRLDPAAPASLLWKITTRVCLNALRTAKRRPEGAVEGHDLIDQIAHLQPEPTVRRMIDQIFAREPDSTRLIAVLHFVDGMTLEETAAEVGMSVSGVRKRLRTLKERLQVLDDEGEAG